MVNLAAPGLIRRAGAQGLRQVRYLTPFGYILGFADTLYAQAGGFFAKEGLDVKIDGGRGSAMSVQQVVAGNVLLSRTGGTDLIKAYVKDPSIVAIGEIYQRDGFFVISQESKPIRTPADMAGKTMGIVSTGGATENLLDMMLVARDVPKDSVRREQVGNAPSAFELVKRGRADAFIATSDTVFQLRSDKQAVHAWSTDDVAPCPGQVYITSKATLERETETLAKFLRGVQAALESMAAQKDNLAPVVNTIAGAYDIAEGRRPDKGAAVLANGLEQTFAAPMRDKLASRAESWDAAAALMVKAGIIAAPTDRGWYDDRVRKLAFG
ncbi:MAG TPA: ABC transporter substrate-binding protein [Roseomonas sp.]|jgi:NitT/TauT family transport system substrate-binding protein